MDIENILSMDIKDVDINGITVICNVPTEHSILNSVYNGRFKDSDNTTHISLSRLNRYDKGKPYMNTVINALITDSSVSHFHKNVLVDLPELFLTPEEHVRMADNLVKVSNKGINVVVTTNSDYLVKQFNILSMVSYKSDEIKKRFMKDFRISEDKIIPIGKYHVYEYLSTEHKHIYVKENEVNEYGAGVDAFDRVIDAMNVMEEMLVYEENSVGSINSVSV